jgi:hypothetical protein
LKRTPDKVEPFADRSRERARDQPRRRVRCRSGSQGGRDQIDCERQLGRETPLPRSLGPGRLPRQPVCDTEPDDEAAAGAPPTTDENEPGQAAEGNDREGA